MTTTITLNDISWNGNESLEALSTFGIHQLKTLNSILGEETFRYDDTIIGRDATHAEKLMFIHTAFTEKLKLIDDTIYRFMDERNEAVNKKAPEVGPQ